MQKILENIIKDSNGCWVWNKSTNSSGYGQTTIKGKYWTVHRYVASLTNNLKSSDVVRHLCHNARCCNPEHLLVGTHKENYMDSIEVHTISNKKRRKKWNILGVSYSTCREASKSTGISMGSIIKYTIDGVFDVESYRKNTLKAGWYPKI